MDSWVAGVAPLIAIGLAWGWAVWCAGEPGMREEAARAATRFAASVRRGTERMRAVAARVAARGRGDGAPGLGEVSEMIDVVRLGLSAGLSFDASLALFCANREGTLARRLDRARLSWQVGSGGREEELSTAAADLGVRALESFALAVGQALAMGAPLSETLERQSRECREAHRAEVERQIERAPVKLLIPTGTLVLPALLLSILGPLLAAGGMM